MEAEYQRQQEAFLSNHSGTSPQEVLLLSLPVHSSLLLLTSFSLWSGATYISPLGSFLEVLVTCLPPLLALTLFSHSPEVIILPVSLLALSFLLLAGHSGQGKGRAAVTTSSQTTPSTSSPRIAYITNFRSSMLLVTSICILAVDFPVFPRRFAKTETFGYGLMDIGVGSFVFSNGLVSSEARGQPPRPRQEVVSCLPLLLLGLLRLTVVSVSGYHHPVTEYGLHWNFFFSLALVKLLSAAISPLLRGERVPWVAAVLISVVYEGALAWGLQDWALGDTPRLGLIEANREGLLSSVGYLSLHLAGVSWGRLLLPRLTSFKELSSCCGLLVAWACLLWLSLFYSSSLFSPPSRRLANYTYFTWLLAYNLSLLAGFVAIDLAVLQVASLQECHRAGSRPGGKSKKGAEVRRVNLSMADLYRSPRLYRAIGFNSLPFFLVANLLTGAANVTFTTISMPDLPAFFLLLVYMLLLCFLALIAWHRRTSIKI